MLNNISDHILLYNKSIRDALIRLDSLGADAVLFLTDENDKLIGSLSDGDVRRGMLKGSVISDPVVNIMNKEPKFLIKGDKNFEDVIRYRELGLRVIPVVEKDKRILKVINFRKLKSYLPLDAIIMAGGKGERLKPLTDNIPKPMLSVGNKTIIERILDNLILYGIDDIWICLNYMGNVIKDYLGDGSQLDILISYINESEPLGTIGAVSLIDNFQHEHIMVMNSDLITDLDFEKFYKYFIDQDADMVIMGVPYNVNIPYAILQNSGNRVISLQEKPIYTYYSNGGIYLFKKEVLELIPEEKRFDATDLINFLLNAKKKVVTYHHNGFWLDIGRFEDLERAKELFKD